MTTTITINGYEVPRLDERPGLKCCVATCTVNLDDCWHYHKDQRDDRRRVCNRCMVRWPDLVRFFSLEHDPTFDAGLPVKLKAAIVQQAACRSFLARVRWHKAKAAAALLQACQRRRAAQALLWQLFDAARRTAAATLLQMWQRKRAAQLLLRRLCTDAARSAVAATRIQAVQRGRATRAKLRIDTSTARDRKRQIQGNFRENEFQPGKGRSGRANAR